MTFYVENEAKKSFPFAIEEVFCKVAEAVLKTEGCPYDVCVNLVLTDNEGIRAYNKEYRSIDRETDVLSFPNLDYERPGDFTSVEDMHADYFDPDSGEMMLGDIMISVDKVEEQAHEYGHSNLREFAFLVAHSMFHLCGYDHMEDDEAAVMERKQEMVLEQLGLIRD